MLDDLIFYCDQRNIKYIKDEPMSKHTSFKIGGPCDLLVYVDSIRLLKEFIHRCKVENVNYMILGNGTNMLVHDEGISGAVIKLCGEFDNVFVASTFITAGASASLEDVCKLARDNSLTGLEFAYGIPGSVGGAAFMNAGAYDSEMKNVIMGVSYLDKNNEVKEYLIDDLHFGYRKSIFRETGEIILNVKFKLEPGNFVDISNKMDDLLQRRKSKQPLEFPSAGSVFKRPDGQYAGTLIQECGLKGKTVGGAQVSDKHSGFIINIGNATCNDVLNLVKVVQDTVKDKTGFFLEREIIDLGR